MRTRLWILPTLALAGALAGGCILLSGQFLVSYDLPTPLDVTASAVTRADVDLNLVAAYRDHRDDLKSVSDLALLGRVTNTGVEPLDVEVWMTPDPTDHATAAAVLMDKDVVKVWGPLRVARDATTKIDWDASAALFGAGRSALVAEVLGDGEFTLYALGTGEIYSFRLEHGSLVAVIVAGK
jgi:hypothetical protein